MSHPPVTDVEAALATCAQEPVHIPTWIQDNGAVLAVDNKTLTVTHASTNLERVTGIDHQTVLNKSIYEVFPIGLRHDLVNVLLPEYLQQTTRLIDPIELNGRHLVGGASAAKSSTIFEFESADNVNHVTGEAVQHMAFLTSQLQHVDSRQTLFEKTVRLLQVLTGYDRIMVYAFDSDGNGKVQAEAISGPLEPYLGLNFPAWDIPEQARAIMRKTPFRYIADVHAQPVPLQAGDSHADPLDMTFSHLRGVSPVHMRYLGNMGTKATFTLNIVVAGQLWGMISMHHPSPRTPDQNAREVCRNFVQFFGLTLDTILQRERLARLHEAEAIRQELTKNAVSSDVEAPFNDQLLERLCKAMSADGALLAKAGSVQSYGLVPPADMLARFMEFGTSCTDAFHSSALGIDHPELRDMVGSDIAGLLLTPMHENSFVAFFRRDRELEIKWAGAPDKEIQGHGADARLNPRGSFSLYQEKVRGSSPPWTMQEHQIAGEVWSILVNAERDALIKKTTRQQKMLIDELNHRVRNILTLIRSLSRQSRSTSITIDDFVKTLEDRIEAVADAHSLAVEKPDAYVSIRTMLQRAAEPHNDKGERVVINGDDVGLRPDVAPIFALVIHELMTNAAKYGALSKSTGQLSVDLKATDGGLDLHLRESGGPPVAPPSHEGFGTRLLNNAVPNELKGTIDVDFRASGLTVHIALPQTLISRSRHMGHQVILSDEDRDAGLANPTKQSRRRDKRCLLVEDSFVVSMDTLQILSAAGFNTVRTAMTIEDALKAIEGERIEFAVLDVNLSGGETSLGIARHLLALEIPFIFVTGYGADGVPKGQFPGVPAVQKPLRSAELEQALIRVQM